MTKIDERWPGWPEDGKATIESKQTLTDPTSHGEVAHAVYRAAIDCLMLMEGKGIPVSACKKIGCTPPTKMRNHDGKDVWAVAGWVYLEKPCPE